MYCNHCGKLNDDRANFCTQCGQKLLTGIVPAPVVDKPAPPAPASRGLKLKSDHGFIAIALVLAIGHAGWYFWRQQGDRNVLEQERLYRTIYYLYVGALVVQFILLTIYTRNLIFKVIIGILGLIICYNEITQMMETLNEIFKKDRH